MDELLRDFLTETGEHVEAAGAQLVRLERDPSDMAMIAAVFRLLHTIKGTCGFLGLGRLGRLAHAAEALLGRLRESTRVTPEAVALILAAVDRIRFILAQIEAKESEPDGTDDDLVEALARETVNDGADRVVSPRERRSGIAFETPHSASMSPDVERRGGPPTVRVAVDVLETIMTLVSELVLARNQLAVIARRAGQIEVETSLQRLSSIVTDLQDSVMQARMQPLERLFSTMPRLVRDLARDLDKKIELTVEGGETELDRQLVEAVRDPLTHILRNCADHGLENVEDRIAAGKDPTGRIRITASQVAGQILIEVSDDGRGLDHSRVAAKALALGLVSEEELARLNRDEVARFIFAPGFSTAAQVTSVSGRGVGLDVVRENIEAIGGTVGVESEPSNGVRFTLRIPLTLAIAPALIVSAGGERFALPQADVIEIVSTGADSAHRVEPVAGCDVLHLRGDLVPLADLRALLQLPAASADDERIVAVLRVRNAVFGLVVDTVEDVQEIVVKPVGAALANLRVYSGHTILGDGSVVLILDTLGLAKMIGVRPATARGEPASAARGATAPPVSLLLFRAGTRTVRALPLSLVSRIETVKTAETESVAGHLLWRREGRLIALAPLVEPVDCARPAGLPERPALMIEAGGRTVGLLVDEIVDVVQVPLEIEVGVDAPGVLGAAKVGEHVAEFVDVAHFLDPVRPSDNGPRGCQILFVEPRPFFRDMIVPALLAAGCRVVAVDSPAEASRQTAGLRFDAIVAHAGGDATAEGSDAAQMRELLPSVPVVAIVAHPDRLDAQDAAQFAAVCDGFDRRGLLAAIERTLRPAAARAARRAS